MIMIWHGQIGRVASLLKEMEKKRQKRIKDNQYFRQSKLVKAMY